MFVKLRPGDKAHAGLRLIGCHCLPDCIPQRRPLLQFLLKARIRFHQLHGILLILHIQGNQLENGTEHVQRTVSLCVDHDPSSTHRGGRVKMIGDHDRIAVAHIRQCLEQRRADIGRNPLQHLKSLL